MDITNRFTDWTEDDYDHDEEHDALIHGVDEKLREIVETITTTPDIEDDLLCSCQEQAEKIYRVLVEVEKEAANDEVGFYSLRQFGEIHGMRKNYQAVLQHMARMWLEPRMD